MILLKKLFRTMGRYKAQFISMIVMVMLGVGMFLGFNMEWYSLEKDLDKQYTLTNFADYRIVSETGYTQADADKIKAIKGVDDVTLYLSVNTKANDGDVMALTVVSNPDVSGFTVTSGAAYDADSTDKIWMSDKYAEANNIAVGDTFTVTYRDFKLTGTVAGLIKSSEYLICLPDASQLMPDYETSGYMYISPAMFKNAVGMNFYTNINVLSDLEKKDFIEAVDKALGNTALILTKDETTSYSEAQGEVEEGKTMGSILPVVFVAIAILTMITTMHRVTTNEKVQIGTLKALGFKNRKITLHYTSYAFMIALISTALGIAVGYGVAYALISPNGSMGTYIDMCDWSLYIPPFCWAVMAGLIVFMTFIGFLSVRKMLKGNAAESLRPYSPKAMKPMFVERFGFWHKLGFGTRWNLRDCMRHKARSAMTLVGVIGCTILISASLGMNDTMDAYLDLNYNKLINYETKINLAESSVTNDDAKAIADKYNGDWISQSSVQVEDNAMVIEVYHIENDLVRFADKNNNILTLPENGVYLSQRMAERYDLEVGDTFTFSEYGSDKSYTAEVAGSINSLAEGFTMADSYADKIGYEYQITSAVTNETNIETSSFISGTQSKQAIEDSYDTFMEIMYMMIILLIVAALGLGIFVLYNLGTMSYMERYREMATLKVLGFKNKKIGNLLISQNIWLSALGVIIGIPCGYFLLVYLMKALCSEYELSVQVYWYSYALTILLTFGVSLLVGLMVSRKSRKINMVEALKNGE